MSQYILLEEIVVHALMKKCIPVTVSELDSAYGSKATTQKHTKLLGRRKSSGVWYKKNGRIGVYVKS